MLNPRYTRDMLLAACDVYRKEKAVLLQEILTTRGMRLLERAIAKTRLAREFHPLKHSLAQGKSPAVDEVLEATSVAGLLQAITGKTFTAQVYAFGKGDFCVMHDSVPAETGIVAFLDCSRSWDEDWAGYLGIDSDPTPLFPGSLLLMDLKGKRWFVKRVSHYAKTQRVLIVLREDKRHRRHR